MGLRRHPAGRLRGLPPPPPARARDHGHHDRRVRPELPRLCRHLPGRHRGRPRILPQEPLEQPRLFAAGVPSGASPCRGGGADPPRRRRPSARPPPPAKPPRPCARGAVADPLRLLGARHDAAHREQAVRQAYLRRVHGGPAPAGRHGIPRRVGRGAAAVPRRGVEGGEGAGHPQRRQHRGVPRSPPARRVPGAVRDHPECPGRPLPRQDHAAQGGRLFDPRVRAPRAQGRDPRHRRQRHRQGRRRTQDASGGSRRREPRDLHRAPHRPGAARRVPRRVRDRLRVAQEVFGLVPFESLCGTPRSSATTSVRDPLA